MTHGSEHPRGGGCERVPVAPRPDLLRVEVSESRRGVLVISPVGEVDVASADLLRHATRDAVAATPRCLVVDLARLTFCGSTGLVVLMDARRDAEAAGVRFGTADGPPIVRRVLEITQLGPVLGHRETIDAALLELDA
jgi:stage II sporulation protein AA (anti-sigma F factor antagonist)